MSGTSRPLPDILSSRTTQLVELDSFHDLNDIPHAATTPIPSLLTQRGSSGYLESEWQGRFGPGWDTDVHLERVLGCIGTRSDASDGKLPCRQMSDEAAQQGIPCIDLEDPKSRTNW